MYKFIDLLGLRGGTTFDSLCELLMELNLDWLMDEMKADLLVEKGELEVEEYIYRYTICQQTTYCTLTRWFIDGPASQTVDQL